MYVQYYGIFSLEKFLIKKNNYIMFFSQYLLVSTVVF